MSYSVGFTPGVPPRDLQLWKIGPNPTDYGVHLWTERSVREVGGVYARRGNPLPIDIEHGCSEEELAKTRAIDPVAIPVTGGYATLEIRGGAPFVVFDWSAPAVAQIERKERLFVSPEYIVDEATNEIIGIERVSLVANPGTHRARRLASAPLGAVQQNVLAAAARALGGHMDMAIIIAAIRAALAVEDPAAAKEAALTMLSELEKGAGPTSEPVVEAPMADPALAVAAAAPATEEEKKKPVAASTAAATPAPAAVAVTASAAPSALAQAATGPSNSDVLAELDVMKRDNLLREKGHRLAEGVRVACSKMPFAVVQAIVDASPEPELGARRVAASTRGATQGKATVAPSPERAALAARMGIVDAEASTVRREGTSHVFGVTTPEQARQRIAARAAGGGAK